MPCSRIIFVPLIAHIVTLVLLLLRVLVVAHLVLHGGSNRLIIVIEGVLGHGGLAARWPLAWYRMDQVLLDHRPFSEIGHR